MENQEVQLIDYLRVLWRQKWVIAVTFVAAVAAAWGATKVIPPTYETETSLLLLPPLSSELGAEPVGSRLAPEAYEELAVSTALLQSVMGEVVLPESATVAGLKKRFSVSVERLSSGGELLLRAAITGPDPQQLPSMAGVWTAAFTDTYGELFQDRIARSFTYIRENHDETEAELERLLDERTQLLLDHPLTALRAKLDALIQEEIENRERLTAALLERDTTLALVDALEEELARQPFTHALGRSISPDSLVAALGAGLSTRELDALANIDVETEELNSTYVSLDSQIATQRARLAQLGEEIRAREENGTGFREELGAKQTELTEAEAALDAYDQQIALLRAAYGKLASSLQDAKIAIAETPDPIRVIDEPLVPRYPIAPRKTTNMAVAGFLGLMLGTLLAFFIDYLARTREQEALLQSTSENGLEDVDSQQADHEPKSGRTQYDKQSPPLS